MAMGLAGPSRGFTGFGTAALDFDLDGWLDLVVANGGVSMKGVPQEKVRTQPFPYDQTNQLLHNNDGHFEDVTAQAGAGFKVSAVSRGLAVGDLDNDGDADIVINDISQPAQVLLNRNSNGHHWLGLELRDPTHNRHAIGAVVMLEIIGKAPVYRTVRAQESYASSSDPRLLIGLGHTREIGRITVSWPDGSQELFPALTLDRYHRLEKGFGQPLPSTENGP